MKFKYASFARVVCATLFLLITSYAVSHAQNRSIGGRSLILDDGSGLGRTITLITPAGGWVGNLNWTLPIPPAGTLPGFVPRGVSTLAPSSPNEFLRWNGTLASGAGAWEDVSNLDAGTLTLTSTAGGPTATALSMNGGKFVVQSTAVSIAAGGAMPNNAAAVVVGTTGADGIAATATLPNSGQEGQILFVSTNDPDGVAITTIINGVTVTSLVDDSEVGTFAYLNGQWRTAH